MDDLLRQRLIILNESGKIDYETVVSIEDFIKIVEEELNVDITEDNGSMFVTHLAMAISRIKNGEEIVTLEESLLKELKSQPYYNKIPKLITSLEEQLEIKIPESEFGYIGLHLGNLKYEK